MNQEMKQKTETREDRIVRIMSKDIEGKMTVYSGLAKIKGISWAMSNFICKKLGFKKTKKIGELTNEEIEKIALFMEKFEGPEFLMNRRADFDTGEDKHLLGVKLDLQKEFDIKRLKKIKSYKGLRHSAKLPLRGQRTKANFRTNKAKGVGIKKKKKA